MASEFLIPDWPAPVQVRARVSTRAGGVSLGDFASLNLGDHVGDDPAAVAENRARLRQALGVPAEPFWLNQVHGITVVEAGSGLGARRDADAAYSRTAGTVCAVLTADCLPVLFCDGAATTVAAAHAGWRGLAAGVLEATVSAMAVTPGSILAWLGPAIGPSVFEVGEEVRAAFLLHGAAAADAFRPSPSGRWLADLYQLARLRLAAMGVTAVYGGGFCTYTDAERFYSYRRQARTGRFASLIWREDAE